jgi:hypothetical protein
MQEGMKYRQEGWSISMYGERVNIYFVKGDAKGAKNGFLATILTP